MPQSLARVVLHIVFSTKNRVPFMRDAEVRTKLHAYMAGVAKAIECPAITINGADDHVHVLCNFARTISIAKLVEELKTEPSKWMKTQGRSTATSIGRAGMGHSP